MPQVRPQRRRAWHRPRHHPERSLDQESQLGRGDLRPIGARGEAAALELPPAAAGARIVASDALNHSDGELDTAPGEDVPLGLPSPPCRRDHSAGLRSVGGRVASPITASYWRPAARPGGAAARERSGCRRGGGSRTVARSRTTVAGGGPAPGCAPDAGQALPQRLRRLALVPRAASRQATPTMPNRPDLASATIARHTRRWRVSHEELNPVVALAVDRTGNAADWSLGRCTDE